MKSLFKAIIINEEEFNVIGELSISKDFFEENIKGKSCEEIEVENKKYWILKKENIYIIDEFVCLKELKINAIYDNLTNCYNKKEILEFLNKFLSMFLRYHTSPFSTIMFDIDYFKKINDTYGHIAGDFVLKELALLVKSLMRKSDLCGRFGGEEFILILPETKLVGAMKFASRLKDEVEKYEFVFNNKKIPITISIGITSVGLSDSVESLLSRVDGALYEAKRKGRNRIEYR